MMLVDIRIVERISLRHFSGKYRETEGAPGSIIEPGSWGDVFLHGVCDAGRTKTLLRERPSAFYDVQLLSAAAAFEDGACTRHLRARVGESARRNGVSSAGFCGDAGARAPVDERTRVGDAIHGVAEVEAASGAEAAEASKAGERGADAIAVCGEGRTVAGVLASAVLRFQRV